MKKTIMNTVSTGGLTLVALLFGTGLIASAQSWSAPTATPPGNNASAPLNVSSASQVKIGGLSVGSLISTGSICFGVDCKASWAEVAGGGGIPAGAVMAFNLASCPSGWAEFTSARGRTVVGSGSGVGLTARTLGQEFGSETHVLTVNQMPSHSHTTTGDNYSTGYITGSGQVAAGTENTNTFTTNSTGGGQSFPIVQPSIALLYCQKS